MGAHSTNFTTGPTPDSMLAQGCLLTLYKCRAGGMLVHSNLDVQVQYLRVFLNA